MKHKTTTLTILGFIGGIVFARYIAPPPVSAAQPAIIEARSFVLEDAAGRKAER